MIRCPTFRFRPPAGADALATPPLNRLWRFMARYSSERVRAAYAECRRLARRHYENFPVASLLVPRRERDALAAIYAFARCADDFADEPGLEPARRLESLAEWRTRLRACYADDSDPPVGAPLAAPLSSSTLSDSGAQPFAALEGKLAAPLRDAVFLALGDAAQQFRLSQANFENLLSAFELDVVKNRHPDFESLLSYCRCSANPVGRLVLELFGHREPKLFELSDAICTALQLTNFWQDVRIDLERGRVYLPVQDLELFRITVDELEDWNRQRAGNDGADRPDGIGTGSTALHDGWKRLMAFEIARTRELFARGRPLLEKVEGRLRWQLRLTWLGGTAILDKIEAADYDVFGHRPALGRMDLARLVVKLVEGRVLRPAESQRRND